MGSDIHLLTLVSSILTSAEIVFATTQKGGLLPGGNSKHINSIPDWSDWRENNLGDFSVSLLPIFLFSCSKNTPGGKNLTACNFFLLSHLVCL